MINVTKTHLPPLSKFQDYVEQIFNSGWLTNNGVLLQTLEQRLAEILDVPYILLVSNGTLALQVAYKLLNLKGEVITTPFSFVATTSSLVWESLMPRFVDIDSDTLNIDPYRVEKELEVNRAISGIVATHVFGNPCDVEFLDFISKRYNIPVIYDAAHAFNVKVCDQSVLNFGDISVLSFHSTKTFHSIEGGALIFKSKKAYDQAKQMINFGITSETTVDSLGINCKMNEFQAAMGLCMLDEMPLITYERKVRFDRYNDYLKDVAGIRFPKWSMKGIGNYSYYPVIFNTEVELLHTINNLISHDIKPRRYFYPSLNSLPYLHKRQSMPISEDISKRIACIPLSTALLKEDQIRIVNIIKDSLAVIK